jgi:hypothetical protein
MRRRRYGATTATTAMPFLRLIAPAGGSQNRVIRNGKQAFFLELLTHPRAQTRVRQRGLIGYALGIEVVDGAARAF